MKQATQVNRRTLLQVAGSAVLPSLLPATGHAQQASRIIVPFAAGASNDLIGRLMADALAKKTGRSWIVENRPGAGSMLGTQLVAQAKPADGRTLLLCATASMGILPAISKNIRYSVERDFTFFVKIASSPFALAVNSKVPVHDFAEFVRLVKSRPGTVRLGSAGVGALDYMGAAMMQAQLGVDLNIIPYKGMSMVLNDLQAGHIDASIVSPATVRLMANEGKVKVLAVLDNRRSDVLPQVPSSAELGYPQLRVVNWWGVAGPAGIPSGTVGILHQALVEIMADPAFLANLKDKGFDPAALAGNDFARFVQADLAGWKDLAKRANITSEE